MWIAVELDCPPAHAGGLPGEATCSRSTKRTAGQHRYYVELSGERVDVLESVGDGVEEYYVGATEARAASGWVPVHGNSD